MDPPLLLMDEPTASLDPARRGELGETLVKLTDGGRTLLITTHDDDFARDFADRDGYDRELVKILRARHVGVVCLAGYMRLVGAPLLGAFERRILNIHPSLLPAFPGLDAQRQALEYGVRVSGATVHLVTSDLDAGPIVVQAPVAVLEDDTVDTLSARILVEEHRLYPEAIRLVLDAQWTIEGRRFRTPRAG